MRKLQELNIIAHNKSLIKFEEATKMYITGLYSLTYLSKQFKFTRSKFSKFLKDRNINVVNKQNICKFNQYVFDNIDSEEKAYWLGFLFADGYVSNRDNTIELSLGLKDKGHLEKFKKFLNWTGNIKIDTFRCRLSVTNKHLKEILIKYGCTPNKSLTLNYPEKFLQYNLISHFNRGYLDGDGCIHINKYNTSGVVEILGTRQFLSSTITISNWKNNKLLHDKRHNENTLSIRYSGKTALIILKNLYNNANIYLDRKYFKYKEYCRLYEES